MDSTEPPSDDPGADGPEDSAAGLFLLRRVAERGRCADLALVLQAAGIGCRVEPGPGGFALLVAFEDLARARRELALYEAENPGGRTPRVDPRARLGEGFNVASLYGIAIVLLDMAQRRQALGLDWWQAGRADAGLIRAGEWWRAFTALGLHADPLHLSGNLIFGLVFGFMAGQQLGWGAAWGGLLLAGALGNGLNALVQPAGHVSVGASTAVFATLGLLAVTGWLRRGREPHGHLRRWLPLGAGLALLGFLGMEGENTDIFAHAAGFLAGGLFGLALGRDEPLGERAQTALGLGATALTALAWVVAF